MYGTERLMGDGFAAMDAQRAELAEILTRVEKDPTKAALTHKEAAQVMLAHARGDFNRATFAVPEWKIYAAVVRALM